MQVDPIKPKLRAPGIERLTLNCDGPLSNFAFNFNLRRYNLAFAICAPGDGVLIPAPYYQVGRCRYTLSKPVLKAPVVSALEATMCWTAFKHCFQFQIATLQPGLRQRPAREVPGRGLHLSTFRRNVSASCEIGGAFRGNLGGVWDVLGGIKGGIRCISCKKRLRLSWTVDGCKPLVAGEIHPCERRGCAPAAQPRRAGRLATRCSGGAWGSPLMGHCPPYNGHLPPPRWAHDPHMMGTRPTYTGHMTPLY